MERSMLSILLLISLYECMIELVVESRRVNNKNVSLIGNHISVLYFCFHCFIL